MPINYLACINPDACASFQIDRAILRNPGIKLLYRHTGKPKEEGIIAFEASSKMTAELFLQSLANGAKDAAPQLFAISGFSRLKEARHEP